MKKTIALCSVLLASSVAFAADEATIPVTTESSYAVTVDFPFVTDYVFRGVQLANESFQPSVELTYGSVYAGVWSNVPYHHEHDGDFSKEIDLYVGYTPKITDSISADIGLTYYSYPWTDDSWDNDSFEGFVGLNMTVANFTPAVYVYHDLTLDTTTLQTSVGYSLPLEKYGTSLEFSAAFGAVHVHNGEDYCYYTFGVNVPYKLTEALKLNVGFNYTKNDIDHADDPGAWGVVSLTYSFN